MELIWFARMGIKFIQIKPCRSSQGITYNLLFYALTARNEETHCGATHQKI
jgi:hypothetical protein